KHVTSVSMGGRRAYAENVGNQDDEPILPNGTQWPTPFRAAEIPNQEYFCSRASAISFRTAATAAGSATENSAAVGPAPHFNPRSPGPSTAKPSSSVTSSPAKRTDAAPAKSRSIRTASPLVVERTENSSTLLPERTVSPSIAAVPSRARRCASAAPSDATSR